jgi:hypothetical protein
MLMEGDGEEYSSIQDIIADQALDLGTVETTADAVRRAIEAKLKLMQSGTVTDTTELYRRLVQARSALDRLAGPGSVGKSAELIPVPVAVLERLERLVEGFQKSLIASERSPQPQGLSVAERMQTARFVAVSKASQDFRNRRALPLATLGTLATALWATRQAFGANLSHVGTLIWALAAGGVVVVAISLFILAYHVQKEDEETLRKLFDPDIQADAVHLLFDMIFTRQDFREALWYKAAVRNRRAQKFQHLLRTDRRRRVALNLLDEVDDLLGKLQHRHGKSLSEQERREVEFELSLKDGLSASAYWKGFNPQRRGMATFLSAVDLVNALEDAAELALARFIDMGVIRSSYYEIGREGFEIAGQ